MSKRKLTQKELEELAEKAYVDFDSDESIGDPGWKPDGSSDSSQDEDPEEFEAAEAEAEDIGDDDDDEEWQDLDETQDDDQEQQQADTIENEHGEWSDFVGRQKYFPFTGLAGVQQAVPQDSTPLDIFSLIVDDELLNFIVTETNRYADQCKAVQPQQQFARINKWVPTNVQEIKKFLGLSIWMGLVPLGNLQSYWESTGIYQMNIPQNIMSRNRFQILLKMLHFANNEDIQKGDRLGKIQPLIDIMERKFKALFYPAEDIVIDETLVPWRGRLIFRQYIPNKTHRYGIKLFKLCSTNGYTWAMKVYAGKPAGAEREFNLAKNTCMSLCRGLLYEGRTLYVDNFYTTYELARTLLDSHTHLVGTLRANRKGFPPEIKLIKLKRGEMVAKEDQNGIVVLKWKDTRDVRMVSTKHSPIMVDVPKNPKYASTSGITTVKSIDQPSTSRSDIPTSDQPSAVKLDQSDNDTYLDEPSTSTTIPKNCKKRQRTNKRATSKPLAVLAYNKGKSGIDLSDQMGSYATVLRKGVKWFRKLGIELILGVALVNAWCVYKNVTKKKIQIRNFREMLAADLLEIPMKVKRPNFQRKSTTNNTHHLVERIGPNGKKIRRKCAKCYSKFQMEKGREEARKHSKMVSTYCDECLTKPQLCLDCFNHLHT